MQNLLSTILYALDVNTKIRHNLFTTCKIYFYDPSPQVLKMFKSDPK